MNRLALLAVLFVALAWCGEALAQPRFNTIDPRTYRGRVTSPRDRRLKVDNPKELRELYRNPDGSCVQCSLGMAGVDANVPEAYTLLVDSEYGNKVRGGSWPGRVAEYAKARGIKCWNVTGRQTVEAMAWACDTGRSCAIGFKTAHFCYLMDSKVDRQGKRTWYVCDNNTPEKVDVYDDDEFRRLHQASGPWCVILDAPPSPVRAQYFEWWK